MADKLLNRSTDLSGERELEPREYPAIPSLRKLKIPNIADTIHANKIKIKIKVPAIGNV